MTIVLDVSAALNAARGAAEADAILWSVEEAERVIAPELFFSEVVNAIWKYSQAGLLTVPESEALLARCIRFVTEFVPHAGVAEQALHLAIAFKVPAYDMFYLALAKQRDARLLTADAKLARLAGRLDIEV